MKYWIFLFTLTLCTIQCGDTSQVEEAAEIEEVPQVVVSSKYALTPFTKSTDYPDAKMETMNYANGKFSFGVSGDAYQLGEQTPDAPQKMCANSGQGQHIHLIVDDLPYAAKYVAEFDHDVADGEHHMLSFLSRSYHESIKTKQAFLAKKVTVANKAITASEDIQGPMLFYSRPKGTYVGKAETEKVMLDFYLVGVDLGSDYQVKATINGEEHMVEQWQPYYITGLSMGENTVELALLNKNGSLLDIPLNPVSRTFTLKADPVE